MDLGGGRGEFQRGKGIGKGCEGLRRLESEVVDWRLGIGYAGEKERVIFLSTLNVPRRRVNRRGLVVNGFLNLFMC